MRRQLFHRFAGSLAAFFFLLGVVPGAAQTTRSSADPQTWDYVVLGNSIGTLWFEHYGAMIESDQSVKVIYHNHYVPLQKVSALLANVTGEPDLRNEIADADIITIGIGFADMRWAITMWGSERRNPDSEGMNEAIREFCLTYDSLLAEVVSLAGPTVIIEAMDVYFPYVRSHKDRGIYESTKQDWARFNECIMAAGRRHRVPVAQVHEAFNGPLGDDDPAEKGYLDFDGKHSSEEGMQAIAEQFRSLGYERLLR
ncbi:SGNH/GDSL hydrolase family protein [Yoonia sediminilitoris]|uniref:Lysophospholipase L1-like esterase n=1 Tax=Yoonia sediminilitoris TaxID=1286148 RepID=A0A2T6K8M6_9RHOB|nr:SGNH/GDSL hydrolase family protein [Yoonia sediminilitoris]PUB11104.1 hypothetical protein C8N45_11588 [Yoonia sediminilitoris]RCW91023.1 hypothetical protein DFP92_11588 [Yoonia sediminilitoris]